MAKYFKKELGRRDFFKKAFVVGAAAAAVPHVVFSKPDPTISVDALQGGESYEEYLETIVEKTINFNEYGAILTKGKLVVAKSLSADISIVRDVIDVTCVRSADDSGAGWKEFIEGPNHWNIIMKGVISDTDPSILSRIFQESDVLSVLVHDTKINAKYQGDCYIDAMYQWSVVANELHHDIHLTGTGALTMILEPEDPSMLKQK